jgi:sterol desaturase/sphingolipid hydroxylase (fatty acid hydroxylase superfamily)
MDPTRLVTMLLIILAITGVFMQGIGAVSASAFARRHRKRQDRPVRIAPEVYRRSAVVNSLVSTGMIFAVTLAFRSFLFMPGNVGVLRTVGQALAILALYDLGYYLLHRFLLHEWSVGRRVHSVHHSIRTPYAKDSLYIHPAETVAGVGLFLLCTAVVGPVGLFSFGLAFFIYSLLNVFIHSGLDVRSFPLKTLTAVVRHHDTHHDSMKSGCYGSISPLWDLAFGTTGGHRPGEGNVV